MGLPVGLQRGSAPWVCRGSATRKARSARGSAVGLPVRGSVLTMYLGNRYRRERKPGDPSAPPSSKGDNIASSRLIRMLIGELRETDTPALVKKDIQWLARTSAYAVLERARNGEPDAIRWLEEHGFKGFWTGPVG